MFRADVPESVLESWITLSLSALRITLYSLSALYLSSLYLFIFKSLYLSVTLSLSIALHHSVASVNEDGQRS